jgi:membrane-associated protein
MLSQLSHLVAVAYDPNNPTNIAERLLNVFGGFALIGLFFVIFAESCVLFFLPGDSLLFTAGLLAATVDPPFPAPIWIIIPGCFLAAFLGNQCGYWFGQRVGPSLFQRPNSRLFKQENMVRAQEFYDRHGSKTIILARFVPVVRTFAPILAGVGTMRYRTFVLYNLIGAALWAGGVTMLGYLLGQRFPKLGDYLDFVIPFIILLSLIPVFIEYRRHRSSSTPSSTSSS